MTVEQPDEIFHIAEADHWDAAREAGHYERSTRGASLGEVGFVHCSFRHQVPVVLDALFDDWDGDLVLLQIDPAAVASPLRVENLEGGEELFPHVYGPVPTSSVVGVRPLRRHEGRWHVPDTAH
jgi:uncharacterized protein (DUF952 family)